nr:sulfatase-like hydrolase/transferase [Micromonospora sp. DSM 115978]
MRGWPGSARTARPPPLLEPQRAGPAGPRQQPGRPDLAVTGPARAAKGAPNVVVILLDDLGFAQFGCYGSDIATPAVDRLAETGLRYNRFHV